MFLTNYVSKIFQFWELLSTYFDNYLKNALFGILGSKVGILSTKISKKEQTSPNTLHVYFEKSRSYILQNGKWSLRKSKNIIGKPRKFRITWWWVTFPEVTKQPLRPEIDIALTKALSQKRWNLKSSNSNRNELTENPKTSLESS